MAADTVTSFDLPAGSCDCQAHVFGPVELYPPIEKRSYDPPARNISDLKAMHGQVGIEHGVIAQATIYGTDHSALLHALAHAPQYRGVAVINDQVSDADLETLHRAGIRAARFGLGRSIQAALTREEFQRSIARIAALGWHIRIAASSDDLLAHADWLRDLDVTAILDHCAGIDPARGLDHPTCRHILELLGRPNWWIMISNADRRSKVGPIWDDMLPYATAFHAAAPDRTIWGTDWPHVLYAKPETPAPSQLLEFLHRAIPDTAGIARVLCENPERLYGFRTSEHER